MLDKFLEGIANQGITGLLLVVTLFAVYFLYTEIRTERNDRLVDMKNVWQEDIKFRQELKYLLENIKDLISGGK